MDVARSRDPLPGLREVVAGLSNDQAHAHFRRTRPVVYTLRDTTINLNISTINLNTELKALTRHATLSIVVHGTDGRASGLVSLCVCVSGQ